MKIPTPTMLAVVMPPKSKKSRTVAAGPATPDAAEPYKEPSPAERTVQRAHDSKVRATADWVDGHITGKKHSEIHKRADKVIKSKGRM